MSGIQVTRTPSVTAIGAQPLDTDLTTLASVGYTDWASWPTPTWTNLTVGNGTGTYEYVMLGKTVLARFSFVLGSTSSMGTGPTLSVPVNADTTIGAAQVGWARCTLSTIVYPSYIIYAATGTIGFRVHAYNATLTVSTSYVSSGTPAAAVPASWTTGDVIAGQLLYRAA